MRMKLRSCLLLAKLFVLVVMFTGCTMLDYCRVYTTPDPAHVGDTYTRRELFCSFEPTTVEVYSIDYELYLNGEFYSSGTNDPSSAGWKTGIVPPFSEVVIYEVTSTVGSGWVGSWRDEYTFHTSEGDFTCIGTWTVLP